MINNGDTDYDLMKDLIKKMRQHKNQSKNKKLIKENVDFNNNQQKENNLQSNREEENELSDEEILSEKQKIEDAVSKPIELDNVKVYADNVEMSGTLIRESIKFTLSLDSVDGVYISTEMLQLSDPVLETIQKLRSYYVEWSDYWSQEIR